MWRSVISSHSWWRGLTSNRTLLGVLNRRLGSSYQPLLGPAVTMSHRTRSLPASSLGFIPKQTIIRSRPLVMNAIDEVDKAVPSSSTDFAQESLKDKWLRKITKEREYNESNNGHRKVGMFLKGAAAGSVTAGLWSYEELVKEQEELEQEEEGESLFGGEVEAAKVIRKPDENISSGGNPEGGGLTRRERFNFIADVVAETAPGLVYIEIKDLRVRDYFTGQPTTASNGSGFIVKENGLILTNAHVVAGKPRAAIQVRLQDGRTFLGEVEDVDMKSDLATVRIPCKQLPVMKLGKSSNIRPGEFVIAMGSPLSLSNTITTGVVSSVARNKSELGIRGKDVPDYIQTDAAITFGNSGGPLINLDGEAIGINSLKVTPGISFAIPIDYAKEFLQKSEQRRQSGWPEKQTRRRYMGITMLAITPQIIEELRAKMAIPSHVNHGILVYRIVQGSPADRAGVQPGDIITHVNGNAIHSTKDVYDILEARDDLNVTLVRNNITQHLIIHPEN